MKNEMNPMYANGISAIRIAMEDYVTGTPERLSSAVRNLTTGILLLCKERLRRLHPEDNLLIWKNLTPASDGKGGIKFVAKKGKTVDVYDIVTRFEAFGIPADVRLLQRLTDVRNEIEHYFPSGGASAVRGAFVDGFRFLREFIPSNLGGSPPDVLGKEVWEALIAEAQIQAEVSTVCAHSFNEIDWADAPKLLKDLIQGGACSRCSSTLLSQEYAENTAWDDICLVCHGCGAEEDVTEWVVVAIERKFASDMYRAIKSGDDLIYCTCPSCKRDAFMIAADECQACKHTCVLTYPWTVNSLYPSYERETAEEECATCHGHGAYINRSGDSVNCDECNGSGVL